MKKVTFNVPVTRNKADAKAYKLNDFDENTYTIHPHPYHTNSPPSSRDNQNMANTSFTEKSRAAHKNAKYISIYSSTIYCTRIHEDSDQTAKNLLIPMQPKMMISPHTRMRVLRMLMDIANVPMELAIQIDETIIDKFRDHGDYTKEATRICHNIYHNPALLKIDSHTLCNLSNDECRAPELEHHANEETQTAHIVQSMLKEKYADSVSTNTAGKLRCRVCKGTDVSFQQKQTRGADEAMTIFCVCVCGARWKMS